MKLLQKINLGLVAALGIGAGIPKIAQMPDEVNFFQQVGLGNEAVAIFGLLQLAAGVLLLFRKTRTGAGIALAVMFLASSVMLFLAAKTIFGLVSLVPVIMALLVTKQSVRPPDTAT